MKNVEWTARMWKGRPVRQDGFHRATLLHKTKSGELIELSVVWELFQFCNETRLSATFLFYNHDGSRWVVNNRLSKRMEVI